MRVVYRARPELRERRVVFHRTLEQVGAVAGLSKQTYRDIEIGRRGTSHLNALRIAVELESTVKDMFQEVTTNQGSRTDLQGEPDE